MDYGTAIAIAVPVSTFIVSVSVIIVRSVRNNGSSNPRNNLYLRRSEFERQVRACGTSMENLRSDLIRGIEGLDNKFEDLRKALGK